MDAMFNVFGFGMSSPEDKYKFFEQKKEQNIAAQKEKQSLWGSRKTYPKKEGYYAEKQKLLEDKYRTIPVSGGKADMTIDKKTQNIAGASLPFQTPPGVTLDKASPNKVYKDSIMRGGKGANVPNDLNWWQKLSGMFNSKFDLEGAKADWTKKGGFEGLMANPAFTMGLAFMQAGAEGKTLGQGALDNVIKAGGISHTYKKIIEDRKQEPIQATAADMAEVEGILKSINVEEGNIFEKVWSKVTGQGNQQVKFDLAANEIAVQLQKEVRDWQANNKHPDGTPKIIRPEDKLIILQKLIKNKKVKFKKSIFDRIGVSSTIEKDIPKITNYAQGGQIQEGQHAIVGEQGPEYFLPKESGKILSNDDSRIFAMLLAANPQLQNVSRTRSEKILRNRFPEYFD
jgi:hypothetical protein